MGIFNKHSEISGKVFDWDAYQKDIESMVDFRTIDKKMKRFEYYVDKSMIDSRSCA